ncbi:U3 small nucleolar RNA-associated protein [Paecilomyces lecythidis]|uniref:U3 small nucleolar RNA-associated protein n=1 Tax=Paecilomyces lecythidis TaxID=3004212 RepID=A0ABR3Y9L2_9EURO
MGNSWRREFRAIRCNTDPDLDVGPFLTGVGGYLARDREVSAPSDPNRHWDDTTYQYTQEDAFPPLLAVRGRPHPQNVRPGWIRPGFILHDTCWELLQKMLRPSSVPLERLYNICLSCPAHEKGWLDWGHDYGSLMDRLPSDHYPWEDVYVIGFIKRYLGDEHSPLTYFKSDPLRVPELQQALASSRERLEKSSLAPISPVFRGQPDCFQRLPQELLEHIQMLLPSSSVSRLRTVSRSFASLPLSQAFWASRFERSRERGFVFEATDPVWSDILEQRSRDWKVLYQKTTLNAASSRGMMNRKRIWESNRELVDLLLQEPLTGSDLEISKHGIPGDMPQGKDDWRAAGGDFRSRTSDFSPSGMPCRAIFEQTLTVPKSLSQVRISICAFRGKRFICGLRFIADNEEDALLGYILPNSETEIDIHGLNGRLNGFILAIGPRGIHALRVTTTAGNISHWVGNPDDFPQTTRLCMTKPLDSLRAFVDGFKLVSLAVPTASEPLFGDDPVHEHLPLRFTGLWYPSIPAEHLDIHEAAFAGRNISLYDYRPIVHVMFGGSNGEYLKYLTKISVTVSRAAIVGIDFHYTPDAPLRMIRSCHSTSSADDSVRTPFSINGPDGERLTRIQADGDFFLSPSGSGFYKYGAISSLTVTTNYSRSFTFEPSALPLLSLPSGPHVRQRPRKVEIGNTKTITGICFMHDPAFGMISLGPISEDLNREPSSSPEKSLETIFAEKMAQSS